MVIIQFVESGPNQEPDGDEMETPTREAGGDQGKTVLAQAELI